PAWAPAEISKLRSLVTAGKPQKEIAAAFPDRALPGIRTKMYSLGLRTRESDQYVNPNVLESDPKTAAHIDDLIEKGFCTRAIADEMGISRDAVQQYLKRSKQKTAAADFTGFWQSNPGSVDQLKAMKLQGMSHPAIAQKLGASLYAVEQKVSRMLATGELP